MEKLVNIGGLAYKKHLENSYPDAFFVVHKSFPTSRRAIIPSLIPGRVLYAFIENVITDRKYRKLAK